VAHRRCDADRSVIRHARCGPIWREVRKGQVVAVVTTGVDPHKRSRTAVALGAGEAVLGQMKMQVNVPVDPLSSAYGPR
jgi:hypothetical protein